jgi:predicted nucleic acid-binding protein
LLPGVEDFELAKEYLAHFQSGLRAGDALHLAVARNRGSERIYSLDNTMLKAGRSLGLPMTRGL